jgi:hypothetical protein
MARFLSLRSGGGKPVLRCRIKHAGDLLDAAAPRILRALPVAAVALSFRGNALSLAPTVLRQGASYVVALSELTFAVAPRITLILGSRLHQLASRLLISSQVPS